MIRLFTAILLLSLCTSVLAQSNDSKFVEAYDSARHMLSLDLAKALILMDDAEEIAITNRDEIQLAKCYWMYGYIYQSLNEFGNAKRYYYGAYKIYREHDLHKEENMMLENLGTLSYNKGIYKYAHRIFQKRLNLCLDELKHIDQVDAYFDLALTQREMHEYDMATHSLLAAWRLLRLNKNSETFDLSSRVFNELGETFRRYSGNTRKQNLLDSAKLYFNYALEFAESPINKFHPTNNIGVIYLEKDEPLIAMEWMKQAYALAKKINSDRILIPLLNNIGKVHYRRGDYSLADSLFRQSLQYNIQDYDMVSIQNDQDLDLNFNMLNEVIVSTHYLDSLSDKVDVQTVDKSVIARIKREDLDRRLLDQQLIAETAAEDLRIVDAEFEAQEEMNRLIRLMLITFGVAAVIAIIILFIRLSRLNSVVSKMNNAKSAITSRIKHLQERFPNI